MEISGEHPAFFTLEFPRRGVNMAKICENCRDTVDRQGKFFVHLVSQLRCFCSVLCSGKHFPITIEVILDPSQPTDGLSPWFWLMKIRYLEYQPAANNLCLFSTRVQLSEKKSKTKHKDDKTQGIIFGLLRWTVYGLSLVVNIFSLPHFVIYVADALGKTKVTNLW